MAEDPTKAEQINLKVQSANGQEIQFKVKKSTQFEKILSAYCNKTGVNQASVRFTYEGARVEMNQTPADFDMEDDDILEAMIVQVGGTVEAPEVKDEIKGEQISIIIKSGDGNEITFKIRQNTPLQKMFAAYHQKQGVSKEAIKFFFDGNRILEGSTPKDLELEDGDVIEARSAQIGGTVDEPKVKNEETVE